MGAVGHLARTAQVLARRDAVPMQLGPRILEAGDCAFQIKFCKKLIQALAVRLTRTSEQLVEPTSQGGGV